MEAADPQGGRGRRGRPGEAGPHAGSPGEGPGGWLRRGL